MMSVSEDKEFEDQIERMKQKNKMILERFQACEEDRKCAENSGSTINKKQNIQIRLRNADQTQQRKKSNPPSPRPKSFHGGSNDLDTDHNAYNQFNESRKQGKFNKTSKMIDDDIAYQDYFHFQQSYFSKTDHNYQSNNGNNYNNRSSYHQNNRHSHSEDFYNCKPSTYRDYQRSTSQKTKTSPRFNSNNFNNVKSPKAADASNCKLDNNKPVPKDVSSKGSFPKKKSKTKSDNCNHQFIDPTGDKSVNGNQNKAVLDDEYIDDTLEDLEKYRLKVDMEDFTVTDPECPDPILAMPLSSWTKDALLADIASDDRLKKPVSADLYNSINGKDVHNDSAVQNNIDNLSKLDLNKNNGETEQSVQLSDNNRTAELILSNESHFITDKLESKEISNGHSILIDQHVQEINQ